MKRLKLQMVSATSSRSQWKLTYFMYFPWRLLEAELQSFYIYLKVVGF